MKIKQVNWYGFDHDVVNAKLTGGLTYCNDLCVFGEYQPVAVYAVKNPDRKQNHKDFVLLQTQKTPTGETQVLIRGLDKKDMRKFQFQDVIHCMKCDEVIYSVMRHHNNTCSCESVSIDGAKDYTKISLLVKAVPYEILRGNLITGTARKTVPSAKTKK